MSAPIRIAVLVASRGRPVELALLLERLALQTRLPDRLVLSVTGPADIPDSTLLDVLGAEVLQTTPGLCHQRNAAIEAVVDKVDVYLFYDDDYLPSRHALAVAAMIFEQHPTLGGMGGKVLADGVKRGGLELSAARSLLDAWDATDAHRSVAIEIRAAGAGLYGCNMVFSARAVGDLRFDEVLPRYGWQEDVDFSNRVAERAPLARVAAFAGVHLGTVGARQPGTALGYSQIANPVYFVRKGSMRLGHAARIMAGNVVSNHLRSLCPEPWIDRRGRASGNRRAIADLLRGRLHPARQQVDRDGCAR